MPGPRPGRLSRGHAQGTARPHSGAGALEIGGTPSGTPGKDHHVCSRRPGRGPAAGADIAAIAALRPARGRRGRDRRGGACRHRAPALAAVAAPARGAAHDAARADAAESDAAEPVIAHVRNARTGEIDVFRGTSQTRLHDTALAAALIRASR